MGDIEGGIEWVRRSEFAEVAEALGVETDLILGVYFGGPAVGGGVVLWAKTDDGMDTIVYSSPIGRDADGLLVVGPERETGRFSDHFPSES